MTTYISPRGPAVNVDTEIELRLVGTEHTAAWSVVDPDESHVGELRNAESPGAGEGKGGQPGGGEVTAKRVAWRAVNVKPGSYTVRAKVPAGRGGSTETVREATVTVHAPAVRLTEPVSAGPVSAGPVSAEPQRPDTPSTPDEALWQLIKLGAEAVSFRHYEAWMKFLFCGDKPPDSPFADHDEDTKAVLDADRKAGRRDRAAPLPFPDMETYKVLVAATQAFLEFNCGVVFDREGSWFDEEVRRHLGLTSGDTLKSLWQKYVKHTRGVLPYLARVRQNLNGVERAESPEQELCGKILESKFYSPCLLELIWSYWHEEGMLVQSINAICLRFQNRRRLTGADPLANLAIDPLRPLSNLLWGYIQDEQHRLTVARRAYEYDSEYGLTLLGQAAPRARAAESRSGFLAAFHDLLHRASVFYRDDDDTTITADAFPVLNALAEVHLLLAEGANNQYRGLTWTARCEMLIQQWLLARPEFREFLPTRVMVAYPEEWMGQADAMKRIQGWTGTSVRFFHDLARFGEQILLSVRYGDWSNVTNRDQAANWCRSWRQEVQWYMHAYQSVTGVDLTADMADVRQAEQAQARALPPAFHLQRRLAEQHRGNGAAPRGQAAPLPGRPA